MKGAGGGGLGRLELSEDGGLFWCESGGSEFMKCSCDLE